MFVHKCEAQLDYLQQINIAAQQLVLIVGVASELSNGSGYHPWKLSVLQGDRQLPVRHSRNPLTVAGVWPFSSLTHHSNVVVFSDDMSYPL